jgi:DNA-binding CsgD family transcriptional regulator
MMSVDKKVGQNKFLLALVFLVIAVLLWLDVSGDFGSTGFTWHIALEILVGLASSFAFCILLYTRSVVRSQLKTEQGKLVESKAEVERWKRESAVFVEGLSKSIDRQFDAWSLSAAEKDVALLLTKGLSHKEIAVLRKTSEKTVRAQSHAVYSKSGQAGRNELVAFFLEDLLAPSDLRLHEKHSDNESSSNASRISSL